MRSSSLPGRSRIGPPTSRSPSSCSAVASAAIIGRIATLMSSSDRPRVDNVGRLDPFAIRPNALAGERELDVSEATKLVYIHLHEVEG
jgi:hypothetical protein